LLRNPKFNPVGWVHRKLTTYHPSSTNEDPIKGIKWLFEGVSTMNEYIWDDGYVPRHDEASGNPENHTDESSGEISLFAIQQVPMGTYPSIECNSVGRRDAMRSVPCPLVVVSQWLSCLCIA
jgi:hypothetical protein